MKKAKKILALLFVALLSVSLCSCNRNTVNVGTITDINDLGDRRIGVPLGWDVDYLLTARGDLKLRRYDTLSDSIMALRYGQVDAVACDVASAYTACSVISGLGINSNPIDTVGVSVFVNKNDTDIYDQLEEFIADFQGSEEQAKLTEILYNINDYQHIERVEATGTGRTLTLHIEEDYYPLTYYDTLYGAYSGTDINFLTLFCNAYNYQLEVTGDTWNGMQTSVTYGQCDLGIGGISECFREDIELGGDILMTSDYMDFSLVFIEVVDPDNLKVNGVLTD